MYSAKLASSTLIMICVFLLSFVKMGKAKVIKTMCGIPHRKKVSIWLLSPRPLERFRQKFYRLTVSSALPSFVQIHPVSSIQFQEIIM